MADRAEQAKSCPECKSQDIVTDYHAGDVVCRGCGIVLGDRIIDDGAEWRTFNSEESQYTNRSDPSRIGGPTNSLFADGGMGTLLVGGNNQKELGRLNKAQGKTNNTSASEKALMECFQRVREIGQNLGLPSSVSESACHLLRKVEDDGLFQVKRGTRGDAMCGAVTYLACRQQQVSRTLVEVAPAAGVTKKDLTKSFKHLERNLRVDRGVVRPEHLVPRICGALGLHHKVTEAAKHVAHASCELDLVGGMTPQAVAGAAVLLAAVGSYRGPGHGPFGGSGPPPPPDEVAEAAGTTGKMMRRPIKAMHEGRHRVFPKWFMPSMMGEGETLDDIPPVLT